MNKQLEFMRKLSIPFIFGGMVILIFLYYLMWTQLLSDRKIFTTTDFQAFYAAARIAQSNGNEEIYNLDSQKLIEESILGYSIQPTDVALYNHPPFEIPLLKLVVNENFLTSYIKWVYVLVLFFIMSTFFLVKSLELKNKFHSFLISAASFLFFPSVVCILNGQDSAIFLFGGTLWLYGLIKNKHILAGFGLALTAIRPQISLFLAIPFIFKNRKVFWWYLAGIFILAIFSIASVGIENILGFLKTLTLSAKGEGYWMNEMGMVNFLGLLRNLFPGVSPEILRFISWLFYVGAIVFVCFFWKREKFQYESKIAVTTVMGLFFSPHLHFHDLTFLLIAIFCSIILILNRDEKALPVLTLIMVLLSMFLLVNHLINFPHIIAYVLMITLVAGQFVIGEKKENQFSPNE